MNDRAVVVDTIKERVSCLADEQGMAIEVLSERTGVPAQLLIEPVLSRLSLDHLIRLADVLAVPVTSLLSR